MKFSFFWIGTIITIIGIGWITGVYLESNKEHSEFLLSSRESYLQEMQMTGEYLGYYKISVPSLNDSIFVQVVNSEGNIISDKKIDTKISVNYFNIDKSGLYLIKFTNISDHQITTKIEIGNLNSFQLVYPGVTIFLGMILVVIGTFVKLKNHKIAHPDENSS